MLRVVLYPRSIFQCSLYGKNCFFFLTSGYFIRAPDNSNFFRFPLKVRVIGRLLYRKKKPNPQPLELIGGITVQHERRLVRTGTDKNCRCSRCLINGFSVFCNTRAWFITGIPSSRSKLSLNPVIPMVIVWILHPLYIPRSCSQFSLKSRFPPFLIRRIPSPENILGTLVI